jgi:DNA-binding MarR family transcriptional regulator
MSLVCVCAATRQAARVLTGIYDQELRGTGVQTPQYALLAVLAKHPQSAQQELAVWLAMEQSTLSRNLQGLARKGWVSSRTAPDTRVSRYEVTRAGRAALASARPAWTRAQAHVQRELGADWDALWSVLRRLSTLAPT